MQSSIPPFNRPVTSFASGADVKVVQQMLGHASATMTLDLYGHLFDGDRLDEIADRMDELRTSRRLAANSSAARPKLLKFPAPGMTETGHQAEGG